MASAGLCLYAGIWMASVGLFGVMLVGAAEIIAKGTTTCPAHDGLVAHQLYPLIKAVDKGEVTIA